jgi:hypothetical protein
MSKLWSHPLVLGLWCCAFANAQTQVNLSTQSKDANLSNEGPTKPIQTGTTLPALCTTGQMFFLTTAPPGSNLYVCTATNTWVGIVGSGGSASLSAGTGVIITQSGSSATVSIDPAVVPTKSVVQATTSNSITLTSNSSNALTATANPTLAAYSDKQLVELTWNIACTGGAMTLSIDSLAVVNLVKSDGVTTLTPADCASGQTNLFTYDGTLNKFKLLAGGAVAGGGGSSVTFAPPYMVSNGNSYLTFGFEATLPPTTGWTAVNPGSSTFTTSGLNGAISIDSPNSTSLASSTNIQYQPIGSTTTLIAAVISSSGGSASTAGWVGGGQVRCGIGVYNTSATTLGGVGSLFENGAPYAQFSGPNFTNPTTVTFEISGTPYYLVPGFLKVVYNGSTYTTSYSVDGQKYQLMDSQRSFSGGNAWAIYSSGGEGSGTSTSNCKVLSWSAQ